MLLLIQTGIGIINFILLMTQGRQNPWVETPITIARNPERQRLPVAITAIWTETVAFIP